MSTASESDTGATAVDGAHGGPATGDAAGNSSRPRAALSWLRGHRAGVGVGALGALAVASVAAATGLYFTQYRPDQQTDEAAQRAATAAATNGSVAILSYAPDTLDHDLTTAKSFLTGDFLTYYGQFTQQVVAPAAKQKSVKTSAAVVRSAVEQIHPESAVVLVFINQTTTTSDRPDPSMTSSSVKVSLSHIDGKWLISSFDPV
ncbi:Mce-associated membrane protein [Nocardia kruczakiae]|uniref:Mce-associated membrane protein n=1 Tax=Nocardia kruczakiae TaxID=261477 RepID=A0ABU1XMV3_9NOCA|nr:twin-arginine translocation pathway signal [Nocardia kruczakiae]MDR7171885.1 Mce-associated membrane protein [Nocardia kruczakiae]